MGLIEGLLTTRMIVTDSQDDFYQLFPNPPSGLVFLSYTPETGYITSSAVITPCLAWAAITLCRYGTKDAIEIAELIGFNMLGTLVEDTIDDQAYTFATTYTYDNGWVKSSNQDYLEVYLRDLFLTAIAFAWLYWKTTDSQYKQGYLKLMETAHKAQQKMYDLSTSGDGQQFAEYMQGAFPEFYYRTQQETSLAPVYSRAPLHLGDVIFDAVDLGVELFGDTQVTRESEQYSLEEINTRYANFLKANCIDSTRGVMENGLPYMFMSYSGLSGPIYYPIGMNLWEGNWGDVCWTSDTVLWGVLGLVKNFPSQTAAFADAAKAVMVGNFFYDVYNYDGTKNQEYPSIATQASIFYIDIRRILGEPDAEVERALFNIKIKSEDPDANGLYRWATDESASVEMVASSRIYYGFLENKITIADYPTKLYFNGVDTSQYGLKILTVEGREFVKSKDNTIVIPKRQGTYYQSSRLQERVLDVRCFVEAGSQNQHTHYARHLAALIDPTEGEKEIKFDDDPDTTFTGRYVGKQDLMRKLTWRHTVLSFACSDPYAYGPEQYYKICAGSLVKVVNGGLKSTPFILTVTGPAVFPKVTIDSYEIIFNGNLSFDTDELVIDMENMTVTLNGANAIDQLEGEFFDLSPGEHDVSISDGVLEITFKPRWL